MRSFFINDNEANCDSIAYSGDCFRVGSYGHHVFPRTFTLGGSIPTGYGSTGGSDPAFLRGRSLGKAFCFGDNHDFLLHSLGGGSKYDRFALQSSGLVR